MKNKYIIIAIVLSVLGVLYYVFKKQLISQPKTQVDNTKFTQLRKIYQPEKGGIVGGGGSFGGGGGI